VKQLTRQRQVDEAFIPRDTPNCYF